MDTIEEQTVERLDADAIETQVSAILRSRLFSASPRMASFLKYIVDFSLRSDFAALKETCIGVAVFNRNPTYDPREDGIVRVEARRLRQKLQVYYATEGLSDRWIIDLPRGAYRPSFSLRALHPPTDLISHPEPSSFSASSAMPEERPSTFLAEGELAFTSRGSRNVSGSRLILLAAALALLVIAGVAWVAQRIHKNERDASIQTRSLTTFIGQEMQPSVSPDGRRFAFVWDGDKGVYNIYVRDLDGGAPQLFSEGPGHNLYPAWSPDGRDIAYINIAREGLHLLLKPSIGGPERSVSEFKPAVSPWHGDARQITAEWSAAWTPDGRCIVTNISKANEETDRLALFSIPLSTGVEKQLTFPPIGASDFEPVISPDGHQLAFFRATSKETGDLWLLDLVTKEPRQLSFSKDDVRGIVWMPDSKTLLFASNETGAYRIRTISIESGQESELPAMGSNVTDPALTPDGAHLLYTDSQMSANIWQLRLDAPETERKPARIISSSMNSHSARFSPDRRHIAFTSNRSGHWEIWLSDGKGLNPIQLTNFAGPLVDAPHWSPDSTRIVFEARPDGRAALFSMDTKGQNFARLTDGRSNAKMPVWSHDGRWIYFNSDATGTVLIWRMSPDGTGKTLLTAQSGYDVVEWKNEPYIYFLSGDQYLYRVLRDGGVATRMVSIGKIGLSRYFDASDDGLYFLDDPAEPYAVKRFDFRTQRVAKVATLDGQIVSSTPSLAVSGDGKTLIYALQENDSSDIRLTTLPRH